MGGKGTGTYVAEAEHGEVIALDIAKGKDEIAPAIFVNHSEPAFESVFVDSDRCPYNIQTNIIKESLKGRNVGVVHGQKRRKGIGANDAEGQDLPISGGQ